MLLIMVILDVFGFYTNGDIYFFFSIIAGLIFIGIVASSSGIYISPNDTNASPYSFTLSFAIMEIVGMVAIFRGRR